MINVRTTFIPRAFAIVMASAAIAVAVHALFVRDLAHLTADLLTLVGLLVIANVGHVLVYGWPLGFPLPSAALRYFPFFGAIALVGFAVVGFVLALMIWRRGRRVLR